MGVVFEGFLIERFDEIELEALGISYDDVVQVLEDEGVSKFAVSWNEFLETIRKEMGR